MSEKSAAMIPPKIMIRPKDEKYHDENRLWQGIPSLERTSSGKLFVIFYSGMTGEMSGNYAVVITSNDNGKTWISPEMIIEHNDPIVRVYDPNLWIDPLGRLWLTWAQSNGPNDGINGVWTIICDNLDSDYPTWGQPRRIANGIMMNKPTVLSSNAWLFPCAIWACQDSDTPKELENERYSNVYVTYDEGETFSLLGGADVDNRGFDEHMIVELNDKRLWMLVRTHDGVGQSFSSDDGATWGISTNSNIDGPDSRFFIRRLNSGRLLLVNHYDFAGRNNLNAMLSDDEGQTWKGFLLLDERERVSYPDGIQAKDGMIYIAYDRQRYIDKEILMAVFNEEDILAGKCVSPDSKVKIVINKCG